VSEASGASGRIAAPGAELAYDEAGSGEPLVLVHGTGAEAASWGRSLTDLAEFHRVIAYDRRGYGRSAHPPVRDYRRHVSDLAAVLDHVGAPAHVLGWSSGGSVAVALAAARPELVRTLVLEEAALHGLRFPTASMLATIGKAKIAGLRGRPEQGGALFYRWASSLRDGSNGFDAAPEKDRKILLANSRASLAELEPNPYGLTVEYLPRRAIAALPMPVTWLLGEESMPWYARLHAHAVAAKPGIRTEWIPGAGHLMHVESPQAFTAAVHRAVDGGYRADPRRG
jgi:pimeloyl-ACP methyl ester carboxylesterase